MISFKSSLDFVEINNTVSKVFTKFFVLFLKVCATAAGRNDRDTKEFATVDWMAYQGAPNGGVTGNTRIPEWWTGTRCIEINLPKVSVPLCLPKF